jgi:mono/diheme cytochrome c family protein
MKSFGWFLAGILAAAAVEIAAIGAVVFNSHGFSANARPSEVEAWFARRVRSAAVPADARARSNPIPNSPEVLAEGRAHWADHCAGCHANDGSGQTQLGEQSYPPAPDMRLTATQQMTDGELFYIIQNGIRFSGMPAWGGGSRHDEQDSWKLVHFIRHLPGLTGEERIEMEKLNPKSPGEIREEQEEERFLKGEDNHEPQREHHHH